MPFVVLLGNTRIAGQPGNTPSPTRTMKTLRRNAPNSACTNVCKEECEFLLGIVHELVALADFVRPKVITASMVYQQKAEATLTVSPLGYAKFLFKQKFPEECCPEDPVILLFRVGFIKEIPADYVPIVPDVPPCTTTSP